MISAARLEALAEAQFVLDGVEELQRLRGRVSRITAADMALVLSLAPRPATFTVERAANIFGRHEGLGCCDPKTLEHVYADLVPR